MTESTLITRDGYELAVQVTGRDELTAPTLLLLAGQANSHHWWDGTRAGYEPSHRVVTFDYRGAGSSRGELDAWSIGTFAEDAVEVLDSLGISRAAVHGTSMGGRVAQRLAIDHPDRVSALVLTCTTPGGEHAAERSQDTTYWLARGSAAERRAKLHELFYTPDWPGTPEESTLLGDPHMGKREQVAHRRAGEGHDAWAGLPAITAPTLVLHGTEDRMVPAENARLLAERIPGAQLHLHAGGRHGFFEESAPEVTEQILGFLAGVGPQTP